MINKATIPLFEVKNLKVYFNSDSGVSRAVDGISFVVEAGKTLGIVGESGCGKSVSCLGILRLIQTPPGEIVDGEVLYNGIDLLHLDDSKMRSIRGNEIAMIFQEPMTSLNPVFTCGDQVMEAIILHQNVSRTEAHAKALEMFKLVGINDPEQRLYQYPHSLSGGLRQRVMIAMALACSPNLLICDEPTTALDVTIQAQILALLQELQNRLGMAIIMITHDLGVIAEVADRVAVMYAGKIVEMGDVGDIYHKPQHPYTVGLQAAIPHIGARRERLNQIDGTVPSPLNFPIGCRFNPRCPLADEKCRNDEPPLTWINGHQVACWKAGTFDPQNLFASN